MNYYAACVDDIGIKAAGVLPPKRILLSYHYYEKKVDLVKKLLSDGYDIFIDSGAFSAFNKGVEIDIEKYCSFLLQTGVIRYASLDVMGDADKTYANHIYMIKKGLNPIPTFHMGGNVYQLERLLDFNYIALGGLVFSSNIQNHCDAAWEVILKKGLKTKVHGFGLTNNNLMSRYPWHSVDSSSFQSLRRFGRQTMMNEGLNFTTLSEDEFLDYLVSLHYDREWLLNNNKERRFIYDLHSVNSYKLFACHLGEVNKYKSFNYLTNQYSLF